jgi:hypothetical protein
LVGAGVLQLLRAGVVHVASMRGWRAIFSLLSACAIRSDSQGHASAAGLEALALLVKNPPTNLSVLTAAVPAIYAHIAARGVVDCEIRAVGALRLIYRIHDILAPAMLESSTRSGAGGAALGGGTPAEEKAAQLAEGAPSEHVLTQGPWMSWKPLLSGIACACSDSRQGVHSLALELLNSALLSSHGAALVESDWLDAIENILIPLISQFLDDSATGLVQNRSRLATLLSKCLSKWSSVLAQIDSPLVNVVQKKILCLAPDNTGEGVEHFMDQAQAKSNNEYAGVP